MSRRHASLIVMILAAALMPASLARAQTREVAWRHNYNTARKEAQEKGLPMILDFGTTWCINCKKLDQDTWPDPKVQSLLNERFVALKVDADLEPNLTKSLNIQAFPTLVFASPDGKIIHTVVGFKDAAEMHETLQRILASIAPPEWMIRDYNQAVKWVSTSEYAPALVALQRILADGKERPMQGNARKLLLEIEKKGRERLTQATALRDQGKAGEAIQALTEVMRDFPGLAVTREAGDLITRLAKTPEIRNEQRGRRAQELIAQARDYYKSKEYTLCIDRCQILAKTFGDLPEGQSAALLMAEINNNPDWLQNACASYGVRLAEMQLALAESLLKRGQPQQAKHWLEQVIRAFPGSQHAESAQIRLDQLQGMPTRRVDFQSSPGQ